MVLRTALSRIEDRDLGDGNDKLPAPFADMAHLLDDFLLQIPG
jgi:hypothetical protein